MHADALIEQVRRKAVWGNRVKVAAVLVCALVLPSCSDTVRTGQASSYLVMTTIAGGDGVPVHSDVVSDQGGIIDDVGTASFSLQMKDVLNQPSANNSITLTQYHVEFVRSDGHNVQGAVRHRQVHRIRDDEVHQPETAQTSARSLAASAPAEARQSPLSAIPPGSPAPGRAARSASRALPASRSRSRPRRAIRAAR